MQKLLILLTAVLALAALTAIDPQYGGVARLQRVSGLRVSEAVHLQANGIASDGSGITLAGSGTHAKGGRPRQVPILAQHQPTVAAFLEQGLAHADGHVFRQRQSLPLAIRREASRQAQKLGFELSDGNGTHSFRKLYANELYQHLLQTVCPDEADARRVVSQALGHNRLEVLKNYITADWEGNGKGAAHATPSDVPDEKRMVPGSESR